MMCCSNMEQNCAVDFLQDSGRCGCAPPPLVGIPTSTCTCREFQQSVRFINKSKEQRRFGPHNPFLGATSNSCTAERACERLAKGYCVINTCEAVSGGSVGTIITNSCQLNSCNCGKHCYGTKPNTGCYGGVGIGTIPNTGCDGGVGANVMNYCVATSSKSSKVAARSSKSPKLAKNGKTAKAF